MGFPLKTIHWDLCPGRGLGLGVPNRFEDVGRAAGPPEGAVTSCRCGRFHGHGGTPYQWMFFWGENGNLRMDDDRGYPLFSETPRKN